RITLCRFLGFVIEKWKPESEFLGHLFQARRGVVGIYGRIVRTDRNHSDVFAGIIAPDSGKLMLYMFDKGTVPADEHHQERLLTIECGKPDVLTEYDVGQVEVRRFCPQFEHCR